MRAKTTPKRFFPSRGGALLASLAVFACNPPPPEPETTATSSSPLDTSAPDAPDAAPTPPPTSPAPALTAEPEQDEACIHALADPPAEPANSVAQCPAHPTAPPVMPEGFVRFADNAEAPELQVELAQNSSHRAHGLMYRAELSDTEGMLFSWRSEEPRSFWMKNTCLALDMLFVDAEGIVVGILRDVPPMNERPRAVPCPAAHVLEVRAGWTEKYGVEPGAKLGVRVEEPEAPTP